MKRCFPLCKCSASIRHGSGDPSLGEECCVRPCALVQAFFLPRADPRWLLPLFHLIFPLPQSNSLLYQAGLFIASAWLMSPSWKDSSFLANWSGTSLFSRPPSSLTSSGKFPLDGMRCLFLIPVQDLALFLVLFVYFVCPDYLVAKTKY